MIVVYIPFSIRINTVCICLAVYTFISSFPFRFQVTSALGYLCFISFVSFCHLAQMHRDYFDRFSSVQNLKCERGRDREGGGNKRHSVLRRVIIFQKESEVRIHLRISVIVCLYAHCRYDKGREKRDFAMLSKAGIANRNTKLYHTSFSIKRH